jgi:hypothetical protein
MMVVTALPASNHNRFDVRPHGPGTSLPGDAGGGRCYTSDFYM